MVVGGAGTATVRTATGQAETALTAATSVKVTLSCDTLSAVTVTVIEPVTPALAASAVDVPAASPVTSPGSVVDTESTSAEPTENVAVAVTPSTVLSAKTASAASCTDPPFARTSASGETRMLVNVLAPDPVAVGATSGQAVSIVIASSRDRPIIARIENSV